MSTQVNDKYLYEGGASGVLFTDRRKFYLNENTFAELVPSATPFLSVAEQRMQTKSGLTDPLFKM